MTTAYKRSVQPPQCQPVPFDPDMVDRVHILYYDANWTQVEIGASFGVAQKSIFKLMKRHGFKARPTVKRDQRGCANAYWDGPRKDSGRGGREAVLEHRCVMEEVLGRPLERGEHVHHINGDKIDNRPDNLCVLSPAGHRIAHLSVERLLPQLLERGVIRYDRAGGVYELCAIPQ